MTTQISTATTTIVKAASSRTPIALLMLLCAAGAATAGAATPPANVPSITVKYDPRSLTSDAGAKAVYRHLVRAAEEVCPGPVTGSLIVSSAVLECRKEAVARAIRQIDNPRLAALGDRFAKTG
jgi:UrcA family protein